MSAQIINKMFNKRDFLKIINLLKMKSAKFSRRLWSSLQSPSKANPQVKPNIETKIIKFFIFEYIGTYIFVEFILVCCKKKSLLLNGIIFDVY